MLDADEVAKLCYERFNALPRRGKPEAGREWSLLAAVLRVRRGDNRDPGGTQIVSSVNPGLHVSSNYFIYPRLQVTCEVFKRLVPCYIVILHIFINAVDLLIHSFYCALYPLITGNSCVLKSI